MNINRAKVPVNDRGLGVEDKSGALYVLWEFHIQPVT